MPIRNPSALLRRLLSEPSETTWLEFKLNNCRPDEIAECISACANAAILANKERAYLVFGIANATKEKVGTEVRLSAQKVGGENLQNWLSRMIEPRLLLEIIEFQENEKHFAIVAFEPTYDRPVRFKSVPYIRVGENTKKLSEFPEYERAVWLATARHKFESAIALAHQSEEQIFEKLDVGEFYKLAHEELPGNNQEIIRRLEAAGFIREDMESGFDITNLGAILIARDITPFPSIASKSVRVIKYVGKDKHHAEREIEGRKGYAVGFSGLLQFVLKNSPTTERYPGGVRTAMPVYPETAIREFIANAIIHQDFTVSGAGPVIEIYEDRIEITNPGNSLISVDRIIDERRSRNERLAGAMRSLGLCEERGGGIDKAIIEIEETALPAPEFYASENSMRVVLFGPRKFSQLSKADRIWACFCHCVVRWIRHDYMSNTSLRQRFSLNDDDYQAVSMVIADARRAGRIVPAEPDQGRRNAKYIPPWAGKRT